MVKNNMKVTIKTIMKINVVWLSLNIFFLILCFWFIVGTKVAMKYDVDQAFGISNEQLLLTLKSHIDGTETFLWIFALILLLNIMIIFLNRSTESQSNFGKKQ